MLFSNRDFLCYRSLNPPLGWHTHTHLYILTAHPDMEAIIFISAFSSYTTFRAHIWHSKIHQSALFIQPDTYIGFEYRKDNEKHFRVRFCGFAVLFAENSHVINWIFVYFCTLHTLLIMTITFSSKKLTILINWTTLHYTLIQSSHFCLPKIQLYTLIGII